MLLPSVTILVSDEEKQGLLVRHHNNNVWVTPGGMIEPDEVPEEVTVRKMQEEISCRVKLTGTFGAYGSSQFRIRYRPAIDRNGLCIFAKYISQYSKWKLVRAC